MMRSINIGNLKMALPMMIVASTLMLTACSEKPLDSLKNDHLSLKYTESFWDNEQKANTVLWQKASDTCAQDNYKGKPNCGSIYDIQMFSNPKPYRKYGTGQGFGELPTIGK
jgi:hypothetical protein